jgi:hypothetical protein
MAKMGTRKLTPNESVDAGQQLISQPVNLVISPVQIQPVATLGLTPSDTGMSIMREGFITGTSSLIGSPNS